MIDDDTPDTERTVILRNSFHRTAMRVRRTTSEAVFRGWEGVSAATRRRIRDTLCGSAECTCGVVRS